MLYIILIAALCAIGYITLPALQRWFAIWLAERTTVATSKAQAKRVEQLAEVDDVPLPIVAYAASWNTQWAREDCLERAKRLYLEHKDWEVAYQELLKQDDESTA